MRLKLIFIIIKFCIENNRTNFIINISSLILYFLKCSVQNEHHCKDKPSIEISFSNFAPFIIIILNNS